MESHQANNQTPSNEDIVAELLTLTCEIEKNGTKVYRNKEGQYHRIYGPAIIGTNGFEGWCKNDKLHREDGPARIYSDGYEEYYIDGAELSKESFIQWKKDNGIKPIE